MSAPAERWPDNDPRPTTIEGRSWRFFVNTECIVCRVCSEEAAANFRLSDDEDHDVCFQQPDDPASLAACLRAQAACPVAAIGHDHPEAPPDQ